MKSEFYNYNADQNSLCFEFESVSDLKVIKKIVIFSQLPESPHIYNLALGDIQENGEVSDLTVSNNADMEKVIATVIQTMIHFFNSYPQCFVLFQRKHN